MQMLSFNLIQAINVDQEIVILEISWLEIG